MSRDIPMLFSAPMVKALLAGTKTQTRRVLKARWGAGEPVNLAEHGIGNYSGEHNDPTSWGWPCYEEGSDAPLSAWPELSGYEPGDLIWVKETWQTLQGFDHLKPTLLKKDAPIGYFADTELVTGGKTRVSIHMPRWASRLTLLVTEVRVERLQDISEVDARAEGVRTDVISKFKMGTTDVEERSFIPPYQRIWNEINGPNAWDANPWVTAITFSVEKRNIDQ